MKLINVLIITALTSIGCIHTNPQPYLKPTDTTAAQAVKPDITNNTSGSTEIICDSVYKNKRYRLTIRCFDSIGTDETISNNILAIDKYTNGEFIEIFRDSIFGKSQEVRFEDFNNDKVRDILVENFFDVRGNSTWYLYLVDTLHDRFKKIKGFEDIKNPEYLPQYNLVDNYVMSGQNWTGFYKIIADSVKDFGMVIYDDQAQNGSGTYNKEYKKAIRSILKSEAKRKR